MENNLTAILLKTKMAFPGAFINLSNELILERKNNLYFRLEDVETELDFKCKMLAWMSRPIAKGLTPHWSKKMLLGFNQLMGTNFTKADMQVIYTELGNDVNTELSIKFIESNYDLTLLERQAS